LYKHLPHPFPVQKDIKHADALSTLLFTMLWDMLFGKCKKTRWDETERVTPALGIQ
jgi:hypothetical protein